MNNKISKFIYKGIYHIFIQEINILLNLQLAVSDMLLANQDTEYILCNFVNYRHLFFKECF